jgi:mannose-6-phosphate isomerase-like protein (cupin superfamily)
MNVITHAEAPVFDIPGATFTAYAAPSRGACEVSLWSLELAPGSMSTPHHMDCEEVFLVVSGEAVVDVAGTRRALAAGDCLVLPAGARFSFEVGAAQPFRAVACMRAGGRAVLDGAPFAPPWAA